ncbi:hypothetical protein GGR07_000312 [Bacteroides pyogenes]|nr:hypothetical protein [Bacteroides pyogenes]SUV31656.1 Uncharacterised protein [Bacteroides pyogenes]
MRCGLLLEFWSAYSFINLFLNICKFVFSSNLYYNVFSKKTGDFPLFFNCL